MFFNNNNLHNENKIWVTRGLCCDVRLNFCGSRLVRVVSLKSQGYASKYGHVLLEQLQLAYGSSRRCSNRTKLKVRALTTHSL